MPKIGKYTDTDRRNLQDAEDCSWADASAEVEAEVAEQEREQDMALMEWPFDPVDGVVGWGQKDG